MRINSINNNASQVVRRKITGQGMTEYIIIVALIAIAAIAAVGFFGSAVQTQFSALGQSLLGGTGTDATVATALGTAPTDTTAKTLGNYGQ